MRDDERRFALVSVRVRCAAALTLHLAHLAPRGVDEQQRRHRRVAALDVRQLRERPRRDGSVAQQLTFVARRGGP